MSTSGVPEGATWSESKVIEQVLLLTNDAVITSLSLLSKVDVLVEQLLSGERDGIDSLQAVVSDLSEPVGA